MTRRELQALVGRTAVVAGGNTVKGLGLDRHPFEETAAGSLVSDARMYGTLMVP